VSAASASALGVLQEHLGLEFADRSLLEQALAHRSWCSENGSVESNERLEFLGDSVVGLAVAHHAFEHFPHLTEGKLSEIRAGVVNARVLAEVAAEIGIGECLFLGKGEDSAGGRAKQSILADAFEAVIAAVYLEHGFAPAAAVVVRVLDDRIAAAATGPGGFDAKTRLQEVAAARGLGRPRYHVSDEGPDHAKHFTATVTLDDQPLGEGEGRTKKQAEQVAAWVAWERLTEADEERGVQDAGAA